MQYHPREISQTERRKEQEVLEFQKKMKAGPIDLKDDPVLRPEAKMDNIAIIRHEVTYFTCSSKFFFLIILEVTHRKSIQVS